jgi:hypothetical protein
MVLTPTQGHGISIVDREQWQSMASRLVDLYDQNYGRFGGGQKRAPSYWDRIFDGHVYRDRSWSLVVMQSDEKHLAGYMIVTRGLWAATQETYVYEIVGQDRNAVEQLIRYARDLSSSGGVVVPSVSLANPVCAVLRRLGFEEQASTPHLMARILCPERIFARLAADSGLCKSLSLTINTPHRSLTVNEPKDSQYEVLMETKEHLLSRLLLCRLNLEAAIEMELVRWNVHDAGLARDLYEVFAFAPWVQWFTDYV